jgi:hypothetical protein
VVSSCVFKKKKLILRVPTSGSQLAIHTNSSPLKMLCNIALLAVSLLAVNAAPSPTTPRPGLELVERDEFVRRDADAPPFVKRAASCTFPSPPRTSSLSAPITVTGGGCDTCVLDS